MESPTIVRSSMPFAHRPLDNALKQIRLLQILPDESDDQVRCTMSVHNIDDVEDDFTAISYNRGKSAKIARY